MKDKPFRGYGAGSKWQMITNEIEVIKYSALKMMIQSMDDDVPSA